MTGSWPGGLQVRQLPPAHGRDGRYAVRPTPFTVCWQFATVKDGVSAQSLQRILEFGAYQTAWAMLHRLRSVLVRPGRDRLTGTVEVDETYFGGEEPGLRGGQQKGKKVLVGVAVELRGFGRCRMEVLTDASAASFERFVTENVEEGSLIVTDTWSSYPPAIRDRYVHKPINVKRSGQPAHVVLPGVHRVASLAKRWLASTHQGRFDEAYLSNYLNERVFALQSPTLDESGAPLLPTARARCRPRPGALPPAPSRRRCRRGDEGIRRPSTGLTQNTPGDRPPDQEPAQMDIPYVQ